MRAFLELIAEREWEGREEGPFVPFGGHPLADAQTLAAGYDLVLSSMKIQRVC